MFKKFLKSSLVLSTSIVLASCARSSQPVNGILFSDVEAPIMATSHSSSPRIGIASCQSFLGLIATGDCTIQAAKRDGGITTVSSVDTKSQNFFGLFAEYSTVVRGE